MDNTQTINILSLCTGYGGLELGLSRALEGVFRVVAVEVEAYALALLAQKAQKNKLAVEAMWPDLKTFPAERFRGCFDFIIAGYPCQPFSVAGKRQGKDDPRHLWPHIARIVEAVRPVWCFFENVPGHLSIGFPEVYRILRDMGYSVEAGLFTASEIGPDAAGNFCPHKRQRLFILAHNNEQGLEGQKRRKPQGIRSGYKRCGQLADTEAKGSQRQEPERNIQAGRCPDEYGGIRWPARPGQPQYEWEEPRVVADTKYSRRTFNRGNKRMGRNGQSNENKARKSQKQAQSRLGGAAHGPSDRVDRLRLLGNGVVPQQAEKAFRELIKQF